MTRAMPAVVISVRPARAEDADALAVLSTQLGYPSTREDLLRRLSVIEGRPHHAVFAAEVDGVIAGWAHVLIDIHLESGEFAEVAGLVVDERLRGKGVGSRLLDAAEAWARERGAVTVRIRSNVIRADAHRFYRNALYSVRKEQKVFEKRF